MEKDKRTGWLKELKVGDEVFVASGRGAWGTKYWRTTSSIRLHKIWK